MSEEFWFRYVDFVESAGVDEFDRPLGPGRVRVQLRRSKVTANTPRGVWLDCGRWVSRHTKKRWACPTVEEAWTSYCARKTRQIQLLSAQLANAQKALAIAKELGPCTSTIPSAPSAFRDDLAT